MSIMNMPSYLSHLAMVAALLGLGSGQSLASLSVASGSATGTASSTATYTQSNVPTGTPLPGNYNGMYRPQVHFSPPIGFMNGKYHHALDLVPNKLIITQIRMGFVNLTMKMICLY